MYFTDGSLFPKDIRPTVVTAAPFGPERLPGATANLPASRTEPVQAAVDCASAGATMLHVHERDSQTRQSPVVSHGWFME